MHAVEYLIPRIPDVLGDHTLLASDSAGRLREHCSRWGLFLGGLWDSVVPGAVYRLSWAWDPSTGYVRASVGIYAITEEHLTRVVQHARHGLRLFDVETHLHSAGTRGSVNAWPLFEIRQREELVPLSRTLGLRASGGLSKPSAPGAAEVYLVHPWWGPTGTMLSVIGTMTEQDQPVELHWLVQPIPSLSNGERRQMATIAERAQTHASETLENRSSGTNYHTADPQASWVGQIYAANLRRLANPFLIQGWATSPSVQCAYSVAMSSACSISEERTYEPPLGESNVLASQAQVVAVDNSRISEIAANIISGKLTLDTNSVAPPELARIRYLCDARGAATAFRLPTSVRGGIPGIEVRQYPPVFHPGPVERVTTPASDHILRLGTLGRDGTCITMPVDDLAKHALVTGFTGSGKTWTIFSILDQLWNDYAIPFWVIESAKSEYRQFIRSPRFLRSAHARQGEGRQCASVRVFTLGNEAGSPFRFNPFELAPGIRVEAHIGRLQTCFEAALPPLPPLVSLIGETLHRLYEEHGWVLTDAMPLDGQINRRFPTMTQFAEVMAQTVNNRNYRGDVEANVLAAVLGRIKPLTFGSKGAMFDTQHSTPSLTSLFESPVIFELNDLNLEDKSLVAMFLLTALREHREIATPYTSRLQHVTVVEEAHNVLEDVSLRGGESQADTRYRAVQAFCSMLTEIRSYGEGLIIADQSPEKLAQDAIRNTNLQIAHQLRDAKDRQSIARAMIMDEDQSQFLGKLRPGHAAIFRTGFEKATFVVMEPYIDRDQSIQTACNLSDVIAHMRKIGQINKPRMPSICEHCEICRLACPYRDSVVGFISRSPSLQEAVAASLKPVENERPDEASTAWAALAGKCALQFLGMPNGRAMSWCLLGHLSERAIRGNGLATMPTEMIADLRRLSDRTWQIVNNIEAPDHTEKLPSTPEATTTQNS
ncbi:MAG: ATP-binding protein [Planctomycetales bacterium]|nr:ATP-binding protein [Planctomycetales bacterium]